ncbi:MAG: hypothetical protein U1F43_37315 [Myxococcota bacterium]
MLKRVFLGLLLVGALMLWTVNIIHPGRSQRLAWLSQSESGLHARMMRTELENQRLRDELTALETSAVGWQAAARKEHNMLLPGEVVYRFPLGD